ncbi:MAG: arylesterase, partial [Chloroflexota bacterium]
GVIDMTLKKNLTMIGCLIGLLLLLTNCSQATPTPPPATATPAPEFIGKIVAVGDSLTEGLGVDSNDAYPAILEQRLQAEGHAYQVVNAGISGETSSGLLSRVDWVLNLEPDIVILVTGGNDGLRGIDPTLTEQNINEIIDQFRAGGAIVILGGMETIENLGKEYTDAFIGLYPKIAAEKELIFIPLFLEGVAADPVLNQEDDIHPTAEGYQVILETVYPFVVEGIEQFEAGQ